MGKMSKESDNNVVPESGRGAADAERREALIKLGKYAAYAAPIVLASVSTAQAAPISGSPPSPSPSPT
jgi:hypothetical protein